MDIKRRIKWFILLFFTLILQKYELSSKWPLIFPQQAPLSESLSCSLTLSFFLIFLISNRKVNRRWALLYCCQGSPVCPFLTTLTYFIAGHYWCLSLYLCAFVYACVVYMCAHLQSSNPVFTVMPEQLMSSAEALLVSEACVNMCVCTLPLLE